MRIFDGEVSVAYHQAYVVSSADAPEDMNDYFAGQSNGLVGAGAAGSLFLTFGLHTGRVPVAVDLLEAAPPVAEGWEDVVEVSLHTDDEDLRLVGWGGHSSDIIGLDEPGHHRVRFHARGMDAAHAMDTRPDGEAAADAYLLQFWPAPPAGDVVLRETSDAARYWHAHAGSLPPPPPDRAATRAQAREQAEARAREENLIRAQQFDLTHNWGGREPSARLRELGHVAHTLARIDRDLLDDLAALDPATQRAAAKWTARRAFEFAGIATEPWAAAGLDALDTDQPLPPPFDGDLHDAFDLVSPATARRSGADNTHHGTDHGTVTPGGGVLGGPATGLLPSTVPGQPAPPDTSPPPGPTLPPPIAAPAPLPQATLAPTPGAFWAAAPANPTPIQVHRPSMAIPALPAATVDDPLHALLDALHHAGAAFNEHQQRLHTELRSRYLPADPDRRPT